MGGPMYWSRLIARNGLEGLGYGAPAGHPVERAYIAGELHRLHADTMDPARLTRYAFMAGIFSSEAAAVFRAYYGEPEPDCAACQGRSAPHGRCDEHIVW